ncbi:hypothetical protein HKX48_004178 [Thoreauomyces humboldtii]|nr:hypothetical protein HKX48_004178 [Thoreauomyces humboldtii]
MFKATLVSVLALSALSVSAAPYPKSSNYGSTDSYSGSACDHSVRSYGDCSKYFSHDKQSICDKRFGSAGTVHGDCITAAAAIHDQCVRAVDRRTSFCWSFDFSPSSSGQHYGGDNSYSSYSSSYKSAVKSDDDNSYDSPYTAPSKDSSYRKLSKTHGGDSSYGSGESSYNVPTTQDYGGDHSYGSSSSGGYDGSASCRSAKDHFEQTGSPILMRCVSIACAQGESESYIARALQQCDALEAGARRNNGGSLPHGW